MAKNENYYELGRSINILVVSVSQGPADAHIIDKTKFQSKLHVQIFVKQTFVLFVKLYFQKLIGFTIGGSNLEHLRYYVSAAGAIFLNVCINFPLETLVFVRFSILKLL